MLRLHYAPGACSLASHIALEESGAPYEAVSVSLKDGEQRSAAFIKLNPKSRVPVLETDKGVLTETVAILPYIAATAGKPELAQLDDPYAFAQFQAFTAFISSTVHVAMAHGVRAERWADDPAAIQAMVAKAPSGSRQQFVLVEERLADGRPFVMGERYTFADPYLAVMSAWLKNRGWAQESDFPKVADHRKRILSRPASKKVLAVEGLDWS